MEIKATYVGTFLSCYLQNSYSRDGQTLCFTSLGGTLADTVEGLVDSYDGDAGIPDCIHDDEISVAIRAALFGVDLRYIDEDGNRHDEAPEDGRDDEEPYIYVALEWSVADADAMWLRDLAERMRDIPATYVDDGDIDKVLEVASRLEDQ